MHDDQQHTDAAGEAETRADAARWRALAARDAAERATTEYARRAQERVANMHSELALIHDDHARALRRAGDRGEP